MRWLAATVVGMVSAFGIAEARGEIVSVNSDVLGWQDSGVEVLAGQTLSVLASGTVSFDVYDNEYANPDGVGAPLPLFDGTVKFDDTILPDAIAVSLICKIGGTTEIGTGTPVPESILGKGAGFVGSSYSEVMPTSGRVFFAFNDRMECFGDNAGSFAVNCQVPEPSTLILLGVGAISMIGYARRRRRMMKLLVLFVGFSALMVGQASAAIQFGPADPVPGFTTNERLSYISPNGTYMLETLGSWPNTSSASRTFVGGIWQPSQDLGLPNPSAMPYLSPDGNTLYYELLVGVGAVSTPVRSVRTGGGTWSAPETIDNLVPSNGGNYVFNGSAIVYSGFTATSSSEDCFEAKYDPLTGEFFSSQPIPGVNSTYRDMHPWISSNRELLIIASDRPGGYGGYDLYQATWDGSQQIWTDVTNLGPNINSAQDDTLPRMAEDANMLFFTRADPDGGNFHQVMQSSTVPEPTSLVIWGIGAISVFAYTWRKQRAK